MTMRAVLLARSLARTRPRQVLRRLELLIRRGLARWSIPSLSRAAPPVPAATGDAPASFGPDRRLVAGDRGRRRILLPGLEVAFDGPLEWRPGGARPELHLAHLRLHAMEHLAALDDAELVSLVLSWIADNPPSARLAWRDSWNAWALSIRCVVWMQELSARRASLPPEFAARAASSIAEQIRFLERNLETDLGGNHLLKNAKALVFAGRFLGGPEAGRWRRLGLRLLDAELGEQVLDDGVHFERSPSYHLQVFADLLECRAAIDEGGLARRLSDVLDRMAQAAVDLRHPDGLPSLFGDGGLHGARSPADCLRVHLALGGRRPEPRPCISLGAAGYFGLRGERSLLLVDCGAVGPDHLPAHGHGDALAFEWSVGGLRLIVDAGSPTYAEGPERAWSRGTRAHNTLTLDDLDQSEFWKSFRVGRRAEARLEELDLREGLLRLRGSHDGYAHLPGAPLHRRTIRATPEHLEVEDEVVGGAGQSARARLLLHPEVRVAAQADRRRVLLSRKGVCAALESPSPMRVVPATWSPDLGQRVATLQVVIHHGLAPCTGEFSLRRVPAPSRPEVDLDRLPGLARPPGFARTADELASRSILQDAVLR